MLLFVVCGPKTRLTAPSWVCLLQQFMFQRQQEMEGGYMQQQHQQAAAAAAATGSSIMVAQGLGSSYGGWPEKGLLLSSSLHAVSIATHCL
jgi:hypothetical protein